MEHGLVAGKIGLRGENVHRLRARDPWHEFHGQRFDPGGGIAIHPRALAERIEAADQQSAGRRIRQIGGSWPLNAQDDACATQCRRSVTKGRASRRIIRIDD